MFQLNTFFLKDHTQSLKDLTLFAFISCGGQSVPEKPQGFLLDRDRVIAQNYNKYQENQVAKAELLAFAINTGLSISAKKIPGAGPAASKLGRSIEAKLTDHLTNDGDFRAALKVARENSYLDPDTGFLKKESAADFTYKLGEQESGLVDMTVASNILRKTFLSGFKSDQRMSDVSDVEDKHERILESLK